LASDRVHLPLLDGLLLGLAIRIAKANAAEAATGMHIERTKEK